MTTRGSHIGQRRRKRTDPLNHSENRRRRAVPSISIEKSPQVRVGRAAVLSLSLSAHPTPNPPPPVLMQRLKNSKSKRMAGERVVPVLEREIMDGREDGVCATARAVKAAPPTFIMCSLLRCVVAAAALSA